MVHTPHHGPSDKVCHPELAPGRSTPPPHEDCSRVRDRRGKEWSYSAPADVWKLILEDGFVSHQSSRSWQKLLADYGPLAWSSNA